MNYLENVKKKRTIEDLLRQEEHPYKINHQKFNSDRVQILLMSDEHIGHRCYDKEMHERILEHAYNKGWYVLHLGDSVECATKDSVGAGIFEQKEIVDNQVSNSIALYKPFVEDGRFMGMHSSNHPDRIYKSTGMDISRHMCREMGAKYLGIAKAHILRVGNQTYTMYTTHGSSGAMLPHTKIKGALDMEKIIDVEIYAMGHVHTLSSHVRNYHYIDKRNKTIQVGQKHFILTGSYLDYWNSYAQTKNMEPSRKGSPILTLDGNEHQIKVALQ